MYDLLRSNKNVKCVKRLTLSQHNMIKINLFETKYLSQRRSGIPGGSRLEAIKTLQLNTQTYTPLFVCVYFFFNYLFSLYRYMEFAVFTYVNVLIQKIHDSLFNYLNFNVTSFKTIITYVN